jgi:hypothetical protein
MRGEESAYGEAAHARVCGRKQVAENTIGVGAVNAMYVLG